MKPKNRETSQRLAYGLIISELIQVIGEITGAEKLSETVEQRARRRLDNLASKYWPGDKPDYHDILNLAADDLHEIMRLSRIPAVNAQDHDGPDLQLRSEER